MKNLIKLSVVIVATALSAFADNVQSSKSAQAPRRHRRKPTGGLLLREMPKNVVCINDTQTTFSERELAEAMETIRQRLAMPLVRKSGDEPCPNAKVTLLLVDKLVSGTPAQTVLAAPEQGWATLATAWLTSDAPSVEKRQMRLQHELVRALGMSMGVGISMYQPCIMTHVRSLADLDRIALDRPGPEGINNFDTSMKTFGVDRLVFTTYLKACKEGWAPAPSNDVQKAIWDEVHALPTAPIKIKPETKKMEK